MHKDVVIGGNGFLGRQLVADLNSLNRGVTVVGRSENIFYRDNPNVTYIQGDYSSDNILKKIIFPGVNIVDLSYASPPKASFSNPLVEINSNLARSVHLMQNCVEKGVNKLLLTSSGGTIYGEPEEIPIRENHPTKPISPYGITKLTIESFAMMFNHINNLPVIIVRPSNAFGTDQKAGVGQGFIAAALDAITRGDELSIYGERGTIRDYIHVSDVSSGIISALEYGQKGQIYNIGTSYGYSTLEIIDMILKIIPLKNPPRIKYFPQRPFDVTTNILSYHKLNNASGWEPKIKLIDGISALIKNKF